MPYIGRSKRIKTVRNKEKRIFSIAKLTLDKKADNLVVLDMRGLVNYTDYFVICSASSSRAAKTIADTIIDFTSKSKIKAWHSEGYKEGEWILLDLGGIIVHIFQAYKREFYGLERLWGDAPRVTLTEL
jgi:ribosome-associated protein